MTKNVLRRFLSGLLPVEKVLFLYILMSSILILSFQSKLSNSFFHLGIRFLLLIVLIFVAFTKNKLTYSKVSLGLRNFLPFIIMGFFYNETDYLNNLIINENLDRIFADLEFIFFNSQPSILFSVYFHSKVWAELMYFGYFTYYLLIFIIPLIIYLKNPDGEGDKVVFTVLCSLYIYYIIFIIFPVAGPQFYFEGSINQLPEGYFFEKIIHFIQKNGEAPTGAFPSSHVSISLIVLYVAKKFNRNLFYIILPLIVLLVFSTVYILAHYVIDVIGAFIVTPVIYKLSSKIYRALSG